MIIGSMWSFVAFAIFSTVRSRSNVTFHKKCKEQNLSARDYRASKYTLRVSRRNADAETSRRKLRSSIFMRTGAASVNYRGTFVRHMFLPDSGETGFLP